MRTVPADTVQATAALCVRHPGACPLPYPRLQPNHSYLGSQGVPSRLGGQLQVHLGHLWLLAHLVRKTGVFDDGDSRWWWREGAPPWGWGARPALCQMPHSLFTHSFVHTHTQAHAYTHTQAHACTQKYAHVNTKIDSPSKTFAQIHICTCKHSLQCDNYPMIHAHMYIHTYITQICICS